MLNLNRILIRTVALGWIGFAIAGVVISQVFAAPTVTLLVDRSYCEASDWQTVATRYDELYRQDQQGRVDIERLVLFSDLGEELVEEPLTPEEFSALSTYGKGSPERQEALQTEYGNAELLSCG